MSLRARLLLVLAVVVVAALAAADVATYSALRSFLMGQVDQGLQQTHEPIEQAILQGTWSSPGTGAGAAPSATTGTGPAPSATTGAGLVGPPADGSADNDAPGGGGDVEEFLRQAPETYIEVRLPSGATSVLQEYYQRGSGRPDAPKLPTHITGYSAAADNGHEPTVYFEAESESAGGPDFRVRAAKLANGDVLILAVPLVGTLDTLQHLLYVELAVTGGALLLVGLTGWWLVRLGLRPLRAIERTADAIAAGELDERVPGESAKTEVGHLARALNVMLAGISDAFAARDATEAALRQSEARMRQFVADASHELRTPLAAVSAYAELFERGAQDRPEDLARVMQGIRGETGRMRTLVEELLLLARMDEGRPVDAVPVELVGLAAEAVQAAGAVGPDWPVRLEATEPVEVTGDRPRLRQVFDNLLANVRAHTPPGTAATVRVARVGSMARIEVTDAGPGFSEEAAARVFERFYRGDPSRSRASGGAGLGLAIVAAIVGAHGGTVEASSGPGGGARISVDLPLGSVPPDRSSGRDSLEARDGRADWEGSPRFVPAPAQDRPR